MKVKVRSCHCCFDRKNVGCRDVNALDHIVAAEQTSLASNETHSNENEKRKIICEKGPFANVNFQ